jgi:dipeptidase
MRGGDAKPDSDIDVWVFLAEVTEHALQEVATARGLKIDTGLVAMMLISLVDGLGLEWCIEPKLLSAKTAREAIEIITDLVAKYGYYSSGESMSISDSNEAWLFEIIG